MKKLFLKDFAYSQESCRPVNFIKKRDSNTDVFL